MMRAWPGHMFRCWLRDISGSFGDVHSALVGSVFGRASFATAMFGLRIIAI